MPQLLPTQTKTLELLTHLTSYSDLMVLVSGPEGSGKTTLAAALAATRDKKEVLFIKASVMLGVSGVLSAMADHWGLEPIEEDNKDSREIIRAESHLRFQDGNNFLVVVDQADQLDAEALNGLAHFALLLQGTASFALFGTSGFEREIKQSPAQAPVYVQMLEPLAATEAEELLSWAYGDDGQCPFDESTMERLLEISGNWPGPLLAQAEKAAGEGGLDAAERRSNRTASSKGMIFLLVATSAVIAAIVVYRLHGPELLEKIQPEVTVEVAVATTEVAETPSEESDAAQNDSIEVMPDTDTESADDMHEVSDVEDAAASTVASEAQTDEVTEEITESATAQTSSVETTSVPEQETKTKAAVPASATKAEAVTPQQPESVSADAQVAVDDTPPVSSALASSEDQALINPSLQEEPAAPQNLVPDTTVQKKTPSPYSEDEAALLAAEDGYIVQLLGTYTEESADKFRAEWQEQVPMYLYRTSYKERDWYVVTTGIFSDPFSAQEALEGLPEQLRSQSPWIRPLSQVKAAIR